MLTGLASVSSAPVGFDAVFEAVVGARFFVLFAAGAVLLLAFRRREERWGGFGALLAVSALAWPLLLRTERLERVEQRSLSIVSAEPLDAVSAAQFDTMVDRAEGVARWEAHVERERPVGEALAAAALSADGPSDLMFVWNRSSPPGAPVEGLGPIRALRRDRWVDFDPAEFSVRPVARAVRGRPVDLELLMPEAAVGRGAQLRWSGADGWFEAATPMRLSWLPTDSGEVPLTLDWTRGGVRIRFDLRFRVEESDRTLHVVGDPGGRLSAALGVQGLSTTVLESVTDFDSSDGRAPWFVVGRRLREDEQSRLRDLIDNGGGAFLLELGDGALPVEGEPLADWSPFTPKPVRSEDPPDDRGASAARTDPERPEGLDEADDAPPPEDVSDGRPPEPPAGAADESAGPRTAAAEPEGGSSPEGAGLETAQSVPSELEEIFGDTSSAEEESVVEAEIDRRSVALLLVIDRSESMDAPAHRGGSRMIHYARSAARQTAAQLREGDHIGIVAFNSNVSEVLPLGPLPGSAKVQQVLASIRPSGGTDLPRAVNAAVRILLQSDLAVRHAVILTDAADIGRPNLGPTQAIGFAAQLKEAGGGVSLILIGDRSKMSTRDLIVGQQIAERGGGRLLDTNDGRQIPALILAEVRRVLGAAVRTGGDDTGGVGAAGDGLVATEDEAAGDGATERDVTDNSSDESVERSSTEDLRPGQEPADPEVSEAGPPESGGSDSGPPDASPEPPETAEAPEDGSADRADGPSGGSEQPERPLLRVLDLAPSPLTAPYVDQGFRNLVRSAPVEARSETDAVLAVFGSAGGAGRPLLGFVNRGLGRIGAFAAPFSESWWDDPRLPSMLATWAQAIAPVERSEVREDGVEGVDVLPSQPIGAELESLLRSFPGGFDRLSALELDEADRAPVTRTVERSLLGDDALLALVGFLGLVLVERLARRDG